jgi:predicted ArsR family transcriptional regulator
MSIDRDFRKVRHVDIGSQAAGIGALADDTRRKLYEYVVAQPEPVGREQAAAVAGLPVSRASFHLDRLVSEGLLEVEFRRLTGRTGPGAGRPAKLYRRGAREFAVSLPERRYDLVGDILAAAVSRADVVGLDEALDQCARELGSEIGSEIGSETGSEIGSEIGSERSLDVLAEVLATQGYEPRVEDRAVVLANCPFDSLARKHTALVCGLNQSFVQGVADGLGCDVAACLEPSPDRCCVTAREGARAPGASGDG